MGAQDQELESISWYPQSGQYQIDQKLFNEWQTKVYDNGEQLGVDFDQAYQDLVNAATARLNVLQRHNNAQAQITYDNTRMQMLTADLNASLADAKPQVSGLADGSAASQPEGNINKPDDFSVKGMTPEANKGTLPSTFNDGYGFNYSLGNFPHASDSQSILSDYFDFAQKVQNYIGSPEPLTRQEIENGVYWDIGPFGAYYKYKNGIMLPDYEEKLSEVKSTLNSNLDKVGEYLDVRDVASNQLPPQIAAVGMDKVTTGSSEAEATSPDYDELVTVTANRIYSLNLFGFEIRTEDIHQFLDWIGLVPRVSISVDGSDTIIYFSEGKYSKALVAALQRIPRAKVFKVGKKFKVVLSGIKGSSNTSENVSGGSIFDKVSDKWREFEAWRERQKYLHAVEMTKRSLEIFHGITPDHPQYEDILAVAVKEYLRIQEESPVLLMGAQGPITKFVYISRTASGVVQYAGITNILARRAAEHLRTKGIPIQKLMSNLSPRDARAVEQALIEIHGLGSRGGTLMNRINSIAKSNPEYGILVQRGYELLKSIDYGGLIP